jgi:hypothetical protein
MEPTPGTPTDAKGAAALTKGRVQIRARGSWAASGSPAKRRSSSFWDLTTVLKYSKDGVPMTMGPVPGLATIAKVLRE